MDMPGGPGPIADPEVNLEGFEPQYDAASSDYLLTDAERERLLKFFNKSHDENWSYQIEGRRRWWKLDDYVEGRQAYDFDNAQLVGHEAASSASSDNNIDEKYHIFSIIGRLHNSNVQRLSGFTIQPSVIPNTTDPDDKESARLGRIALSNFFYNSGESRLKLDIATIIDKYGCVFQKVYFDPNLGRMIHPLIGISDPMTGEVKPQYDMNTLEPEGEVVMEHWPPQNIILPMNCRNLKNADWLEEVHVETTNWIWRTFKIKVEPEAIGGASVFGPERTNANQRDLEYAQGTIKNSVVLKMRYINPSPEFARGAIVFYSKNHIYRCTDMRTYFDSLQDIWQTASAIKSDKTPYGRTWLWDEIPVQDALNTSMTSAVNYVEAYGMLQSQASDQANLKVDKIDNSTLRIISYRGDKGLEPLQHAPLPETHMQVTQMMLSMSESLGAAHDMRRPTGTPSGNAINSLRQIDDSMLRPCVESIGEMLQKGCKTLLSLMGEHYTNARIMHMMGKEGWEVKEDFTGKMLNDNFNAQINLLTGLSDDPGVRQESVIKYLASGIITDPIEARLLLGMNNTDEMMEAIQKQNEIASRVVKGLADYPNNYFFDPMTGQEKCKVMWHEWDNHQLIIKKEIEWMQENFDNADPAIQRAFQADLSQRQQWLAALTMPPPPGAGAPSGAMTPSAHFGAGAPPPPQGSAPPPKAPGQDSRQHPSQQPPRPVVAPASTGSAQV